MLDGDAGVEELDFSTEDDSPARAWERAEQLVQEGYDSGTRVIALIDAMTNEVIAYEGIRGHTSLS